ncbi:MAG TPA: ROK family glucokinase [Actinomycetota bacterium]|nr:ROK family glucokinase [Actinomycetota bacterium]
MAEAIGIDLGGTKIAAGVVDELGRVVRSERMPSDLDDAAELERAVRDLVGRLDAPDAAAVGVGAAGIVDFESGRYLYGPNTGLRDVPMREVVAGAVGRPVVVDNDANCAAWAEHRFGAGKGTRHFICVTLGTGVGGGIVIDGRPYRGAHGGAAEIGHMLADPDGPLCGCGRLGCWEQFASGRALERMAREELGAGATGALAAVGAGSLRGETVTRAARDGDEVAVRIVNRLAEWIGWGFASLVNVFDPERIAVGGGLAREWDLLADRAVRAMRERVEAPDYRPLPDIVAAELGGEAGMVGAGWMALERLAAG